MKECGGSLEDPNLLGAREFLGGVSDAPHHPKPLKRKP